jgi:inner membrane protein
LEPVTHFLTGACLARAGFNRRTALATATMTLAAEAPDLDVLASFKSPLFGFAHHRGFTHSFFGAGLVALVVVGFVWIIWRLRGRPIKDPNRPPRWGLLLAFAYLAALSHLLLDFTNNYGVRPFWPFSERWYSWDIVFIVDPILLILLTGGLVLPAFLALVDRDMGVRHKGPRGRWGATLALIGIIVAWGTRDFEHRRAVGALEARSYEGANPVRASAFPLWWTPFQWTGIVETTNFFASMPVDSARPEVDPNGEMQVYYKPEETPVTLAAKNSLLGRVYLDWAQYPVTETEPLDGGNQGYVVRFKDLRFARPGTNGRSVLSSSVILDRNLKVVAVQFGRRTSPPD